ncbi:MAG: GNAT family N-acetyltransferase [Deltaproteobacteria bacterium]|nr:GNAT family N-acetyltransferase [Deltaproteobacteria bacterium]
MATISIRPSNPADVELILGFIGKLAEYEKLSHEVVATPERLRRALFGGQRYAECVIAELDAAPVGFALFFHTFSTFLAQPGIYLEDLFVLPEARQNGVGKALLQHLAALAVERGCGRFEWAVLDWNEPAIRFYRSQGSRALEEWTVHRVSGEALPALAAGTPIPAPEPAPAAKPPAAPSASMSLPLGSSEPPAPANPPRADRPNQPSPPNHRQGKKR